MFQASKPNLPHLTHTSGRDPSGPRSCSVRDPWRLPSSRSDLRRAAICGIRNDCATHASKLAPGLNVSSGYIMDIYTYVFM